MNPKERDVHNNYLLGLLVVAGHVVLVVGLVGIVVLSNGSLNITPLFTNAGTRPAQQIPIV